MSDFAKTILEAAGVAFDGGRARGWGALADRLTEGVILAVKPFRLFLKCAADVGGVRPGEDFFEMFLGHGRAGAAALLAAYEDVLNDDPASADKRKQEWWALAEVARQARAKGLIDFDLNDWRPNQADPGKVKIGVYLAAETAERARVAAFTLKLSMSAMVEHAVIAELGRIEQERGAAISPRPEPPAAATNETRRGRATATA